MITSSDTYVALVVMILGAILPRFGVTLGSSELTTMVQALIVIVSGIYVAFKHRAVVASANAGIIRAGSAKTAENFPVR